MSAEEVPEFPRRVRVVYADGAEEMGTAVDATHVDVGPMGLQVKQKEVVEIDGVPKRVVGFGRPRQPLSEEGAVRLRLGRL